MAATNFVTTGTLSEKEDLANFISMISRDETPFLSSIGKTKSKAIYHEWQTDELTAPGSGATAEGASFATVAAAQVGGSDRTRLGNYTQINSKTVSVSGSKRAVDQAGVADEYAYQLKKRGTELRRDIEHDAVHSFHSSNGSGTRTMGGYQAYCNDAALVVNAGAAGAYTAPGTTGVGTAGVIARGASDANLADIELSQVDDVMQAIYEAGGKASTLMTSPLNKRTLSSKAHATGNNTVRNLDDTGKIRQSIEMFDSDFGEIRIVPNYIMGLAHNTTGGSTTNSANFSALVYDPSFFNIATLRPLQETEVGQAGDSTIGQIVEECTLEVRNPKGCGMIVGLGGAA
tara:strand:+ start:6350 stop:7384 length:1035 start_codon:yes stop_codon:yes gene_type:complete